MLPKVYSNVTDFGQHIIIFDKHEALQFLIKFVSNAVV